MPASHSFDTLHYTKRAIAAGCTASQAEFHAEEMANLIETSLVSRSVLRYELTALESKLQKHQFQMAWLILGGVSTILTIIEVLLHTT